MVFRIRKSKDRHHNGQKKKYKQRPTKHYTENYRSSNTRPLKSQGWTQVLQSDISFPQWQYKHPL